MEKVVSVNLNGRAYHVEEPGYLALTAYLGDAGRQLAADPDRAEILRDLEQAIAEKCDRVLGPQKTVVTASEISGILAEMGPVETPDGAAAAADAAGPADGKGEPRAANPSKRLYQIREGAMISGVCTGLAAYFDVDITIMRIAFVILALVTKGVWLLAYGVMMLVIPYAETAEERAAASGQPFSAQDLIDQAKRNYADFKNNKHWRRQWRRQQREWYRHWRGAVAPHAWGAPAAYASPVWVRPAAPMFGLINAALALALVFAMFSLLTTQAVLGVPLPEGVPLWAGFLVLIAVYQAVAMPFIAAHRAATHPASPGFVVWVSPLTNIVWLCAVGYGLWYGYHHVPAVRDAIETVLTTLRQTVAPMQEK
jgi:phage shock protein PspC (stress-responsive transcriptional regulator)